MQSQQKALLFAEMSSAATSACMQAKLHQSAIFCELVSKCRMTAVQIRAEIVFSECQRRSTLLVTSLR